MVHLKRQLEIEFRRRDSQNGFAERAVGKKIFKTVCCPPKLVYEELKAAVWSPEKKVYCQPKFVYGNCQGAL